MILKFDVLFCYTLAPDSWTKAKEGFLNGLLPVLSNFRKSYPRPFYSKTIKMPKVWTFNLPKLSSLMLILLSIVSVMTSSSKIPGIKGKCFRGIGTII